MNIPKGIDEAVTSWEQEVIKRTSTWDERRAFLAGWTHATNFREAVPSEAAPPLCLNEFQLKHGYFCQLPRGHSGDHEAECPNPQFHQRWSNEAAQPSEAVSQDGRIGGEGPDWNKVHGLLEPWREVWEGDRSKLSKYPTWLVNAAEELFAHDMCDAWDWNDYVHAASVIIARHYKHHFNGFTCECKECVPVEAVPSTAAPPRELTEAEKIAQAVAEGYPDVDQTCSECQTIFKNYHHFIRCDRRPCPMSDGKGTILEQLIERNNREIAEAAQPSEAVSPTTYWRNEAEKICVRPWQCKARISNMGASDPQECNWPFCGCDPTADKVIESLQESGCCLKRNCKGNAVSSTAAPEQATYYCRCPAPKKPNRPWSAVCSICNKEIMGTGETAAPEENK
jgi:hypothetical protein